MRRTVALCVEVLADLEAGRVASDTKGVEEFYGVLEASLSRLRPLLGRADTTISLPTRRK